MLHHSCSTLSFFFFNDTATTEIYTLSLHDALPISLLARAFYGQEILNAAHGLAQRAVGVIELDRKSTRLNSSHGYISYAVFCLKKKKKTLVLRCATVHHTRICVNVVLVNFAVLLKR